MHDTNVTQQRTVSSEGTHIQRQSFYASNQLSPADTCSTNQDRHINPIQCQDLYMAITPKPGTQQVSDSAVNSEGFTCTHRTSVTKSNFCPLRGFAGLKRLPTHQHDTQVMNFESQQKTQATFQDPLNKK